VRFPRSLTDSLRPARLDLDPEIQLLAAEEGRSGSRDGGPGSDPG
jgi:hypothetical protein